MGVRCEGVKGAIADFVCFLCPLVASAGAIPPATINTAAKEKSTQKTQKESDEQCRRKPF